MAGSSRERFGDEALVSDHADTDECFSRHETASRRVRPVLIVGSVDPGQGPSWENADG
jgi:hypothetical protein